VARESMLNAYPSLRRLYTEGDGNCVVYTLNDATATFYTFGGEPKTIRW